MTGNIRWIAGLCALIGGNAVWASGPAGIKLDGTLGSSATLLSGPNYAITQSLGKLSGGNLFFSFQYFNVATGETALFSTTTAGINNVISRVTGGYASTIDGTIELQAASGAPNFFLVNPSGVTFTANAIIDVPAAFYVSTANYLKFSDGNFYVDPSKMSTLSAAPPEAFGFLGSTRAPVTVQGSSLSSGGSAPFGIVAGDISIDGNNSGIVSAGGGDVRLIAIGAQPGEVPLSGRFEATDGSITFENGSVVLANGEASVPAGGIYVSAGALTIQGAGFSQGGIESTASAAGARPILVDVAGPLQVTDGAEIESDSNGPGAAANITVNAGSLAFDAGAIGLITGISSNASSANTGNIMVTVGGAATLEGGGQITTAADSGNAGCISLSAGSLSIVGSATGFYPQISTGAYISSGVAGNIDVHVAGPVVLANSGEISSLTLSSGNAGDVTLQAASLSINGESAIAFTGVSSDTYSGSATAGGGRVSVTVNTLDIVGSTAGPTGIASNSGSPYVNAGGPAGTVVIDVSGAAELSQGALITSDTYSSGRAGGVSLTAGSLSIDGGGTPNNTGISSSVGAGASGDAGQVTVAVSGALTVSGGGGIVSLTDGSGNAGTVQIAAGSITLDSTDSPILSQLSSSSDVGATGNAGAVLVKASGPVTIGNGSRIVSVTSGPGDAGNISINAQSLMVSGSDAGVASEISSAAQPESTGRAGQIEVTTSAATVLTGGAQILSEAVGTGDAGDVRIQAGSVTVEGGNATFASEISSSAGDNSNAGRVNVTTPGSLTLANGGLILSTTDGHGNAGDVTVEAESLVMYGQWTVIASNGKPTPLYSAISSTADSDSTGNAGTVAVTVSGAALISDGAQIQSGTYGPGDAGTVRISAGSLTLDSTNSTQSGYISSSSGPGATGSAGTVIVDASGQVLLSGGGQILSAAFGAGDAGEVRVQAGSITVEGSNSTLPSEISSSAEAGSTGNAGHVSVTTPGSLTLANGGLILSTTDGHGNAGNVTVEAGSLVMYGESTVVGSNGMPAQQFSEISSAAESNATGNAGSVAVTVSGAAIVNDGGEILSATHGPGDAGDVTLTSASLLVSDSQPDSFAGISSAADDGSHGHAGDVSVTTSGPTIIEDGGQLLSATFAAGSAGSVSLKAGSLAIDGSGSTIDTGIFSGAHSGSSGIAGAVNVQVSGTATLSNGGQISSAAQDNSSGQTGIVSVSAATLVLESGGKISIENAATVANPAGVLPTRISVQAGEIQMNGGDITAASTGNIAASSLDVRYSQSLFMDPSTISTASIQGNGGPITIIGEGPLWIEDSNITTSVLGKTNGNGGDISINVPYILLSSGAIQANTTAPRASGGDVRIDAQALIPSYESYVLGGSSVTFDPATAGLNVVQAAAPDGVSGTLNVTVPTLDLGNSLLGLTGAPATPSALGRSVCSYRQGSSLSIAGRGGLPVSARDPLWMDAEDEATDAPNDPASPPTAGKPGERTGAVAAIACR